MPQTQPESTEERLQRNLRDLVRQVEPASPAEPSPAEPASSPHGTSSQTLGQRIAQGVPLSHATGRATFLNILEQDRLLSWLKLVEKGLRRAGSGGVLSAEATLGTEGSVFTYAAPFRYPETSCGLLFKTQLERDRADQAVATPFDSGGTLRYLRPGDSTEEQIVFVRSHELPVPDYRLALEMILDHFFASPWDYIDGKDPAQPWPLPVEEGDWRRWTFEVRFRDEIRLTGSLLAVFLPVAVASEQRVLRQVAQWRRDGVDVKLFRTPRTDDWRILQGSSVEYLKDYLG